MKGKSYTQEETPTDIVGLAIRTSNPRVRQGYQERTSRQSRTGWGVV